MKSPPSAKSGEAHVVRHVPLVLKDNLREVRLNAKIGAKRWIENFEEIFSELPAPIGKPFGLAARVGTRMLDMADKTAVSLLTTDGDYRKGMFRLAHPCAWNASNEVELQERARALYWGLKELLKIKNQSDFMVLEEAVYRACDVFRSALTDPAIASNFGSSSASALSLKSAFLMKALYDARPVAYRRTLTVDETELIEAAATLNVFACAGVVIATEIAELFPNDSSHDETHEALRMADEVTAARLNKIDIALHSAIPVEWTAKELDFIVRHI